MKKWIVKEGERIHDEFLTESDAHNYIMREHNRIFRLYGQKVRFKIEAK